MVDQVEGKGWMMLRGAFAQVLEDGIAADAVITDPPYSAKTHGGQHEARDGIGYAAWAPETAEHYARVFADWARGWTVVLTDHILAPHFAAGAEAAKRYVFAPIPIVTTGSTVRLRGDGPASWTVWGIMSRPRNQEFAGWGARPGAYIGKGAVKGEPIRGVKQIEIMRAIIRDYTKPGDLILDPCAGTGTTLIAAVLEGREAIGVEENATTFERAIEKIRGAL